MRWLTKTLPVAAAAPPRPLPSHYRAERVDQSNTLITRKVVGLILGRKVLVCAVCMFSMCLLGSGLVLRLSTGFSPCSQTGSHHVLSIFFSCVFLVLSILSLSRPPPWSPGFYPCSLCVLRGYTGWFPCSLGVLQRPLTLQRDELSTLSNSSHRLALCVHHLQPPSFFSH